MHSTSKKHNSWESIVWTLRTSFIALLFTKSFANSSHLKIPIMISNYRTDSRKAKADKLTYCLIKTFYKELTLSMLMEPSLSKIASYFMALTACQEKTFTDLSILTLTIWSLEESISIRASQPKPQSKKDI